MDRLEALKVPATLLALLQVRLDSLPRSEREALRAASVVGRLFWDDVVADLLDLKRDTIFPTLEAIRRRDLIFRRDISSFDGVEEYLFKHGLLRDVVYETVLLRNRARFHGSVARWLETHVGDRLGEYAGLIAEHHVWAGEGLKAAELLERAGDEAMKVGTHAPARRALERALALRAAAGQTSGRGITRTMIGLGRAMFSLGDLPAAETALERGLVGAREAGDPSTEAEALIGLAMVANAHGDYGRARDTAKAALSPARVTGGRTLARALWVMAYASWSLGDLASAEPCAMQALQVAREIGEPVDEIDALNILGNITTTKRDLARAIELSKEVLALARRTNHLSYQARSLLNLGYLAYILGDYEKSRAHSLEALAQARELGSQLQTVTVLGNIAAADIKLGNLAAARRGNLELLALARELGYMPSVAAAVFTSGQILQAEGDQSRALTLYGLACTHPSLEHQIRMEVDEEIASLDLPPASVKAMLAAGEALDFETVVAEIMDGKW
jgi:tetratricopeptide (TPR) repeat protein